MRKDTRSRAKSLEILSIHAKLSYGLGIYIFNVCITQDPRRDQQQMMKTPVHADLGYKVGIDLYNPFSLGEKILIRH